MLRDLSQQKEEFLKLVSLLNERCLEGSVQEALVILRSNNDQFEIQFFGQTGTSLQMLGAIEKVKTDMCLGVLTGKKL